MDAGDQILKCRDDKNLIVLAKAPPKPDDGGVSFSIGRGSECSWLKEGETVIPKVLRSRIEPWLTALFQSEHLALLVGSGLSRSVFCMATGKDIPAMNFTKFSNYEAVISAQAKKTAEKAGRNPGNIEDQIRVANELLSGLEILGEKDGGMREKAAELRDELVRILADFAKSILKSENELINADREKLELTFNYFVSFLMSFASRTGTRDRLQIFTTNYDRFIEAGAELAGLHLLDRFLGSLAPIFRSSRLDVDMHYEPPGIRGEPRYLEGVARFTKLHGSLDWIYSNNSIKRIGLPFGAEAIGPYLAAPGFKGADALQVMIYPNAAKDRETAAYPYVDLFRDFAAAVCRPNSTVISFGYSFGDEHINRVIEDMLTIPSTHLVVISRSDPLGRIARTYEKLGKPAQLTILMGDHLGDFRTLVDYYLPKPAIDITTKRMADLIKARWTSTRGGGDDDKTEDAASRRGIV